MPPPPSLALRPAIDTRPPAKSWSDARIRPDPPPPDQPPLQLIESLHPVEAPGSTARGRWRPSTPWPPGLTCSAAGGRGAGAHLGAVVRVAADRGTDGRRPLEPLGHWLDERALAEVSRRVRMQRHARPRTLGRPTSGRRRSSRCGRSSASRGCWRSPPTCAAVAAPTPGRSSCTGSANAGAVPRWSCGTEETTVLDPGLSLQQHPGPADRERDVPPVGVDEPQRFGVTAPSPGALRLRPSRWMTTLPLPTVADFTERAPLTSALPSGAFFTDMTTTLSVAAPCPAAVGVGPAVRADHITPTPVVEGEPVAADPADTEPSSAALSHRGSSAAKVQPMGLASPTSFALPSHPAQFTNTLCGAPRDSPDRISAAARSATGRGCAGPCGWPPSRPDRACRTAVAAPTSVLRRALRTGPTRFGKLLAWIATSRLTSPPPPPRPGHRPR